MGAFPLFQEGGSGRKYESVGPGRYRSRERSLTLFQQFDIFTCGEVCHPPKNRL
jgi:hypothetical protein